MKPLIILLALLGIVGVNCVSTEVQIRIPEEYQGEPYDAMTVSPRAREDILGFLVLDKTDENEYVQDQYMCEHFAANLWWNAYNEGIQGCIVWVYTSPGFHALVKFDTTDGTLWVEPARDITSTNCWYEVWKSFCGENAFNKCINILGK